MPLAPGTHLGPYEITAPLGAGGMGEVYRARDTRLERNVAIKILPEQLCKDPTRKQRFEREAKTISSLNHPHICTLHDIGSQNGIDYLVMECVEGETLAKRLEKGPLPLEQVLKYGAQIADALDKAHRAGIVHRDLKPGNIMLTASGAKLLDFGLAKPVAAPVSGMTLTATTPVTQEGTIAGTYPYMSPEQVEGKELDGRSDIFSLGAVLYEMLTGQRAFEGKSQLSVASAILEREPTPINGLKPLTPLSFEHAVQRCLAKNPDDRWQAARDVALELTWVADGAGTSRGAAVTPRSQKGIVWGLAVACFGLLFWLGLVHVRTPAVPRQKLRLSLLPPVGTSFSPRNLSISPDGQKIAFVAESSERGNKLWIRSLSSGSAQELNSTESAVYPFWSGDSRQVGFFASGKLKTIDPSSGAIQIVCDAPPLFGATWNEHGVIVFSSSLNGSLLQVAASGGVPKPATKVGDDEAHRWPFFLPDGEHFVYFSALNLKSPDQRAGAIYVGSLSSLEGKLISTEISNNVQYGNGKLFFEKDRSLMAQPFDANRLELTGSPEVIAPQELELGVAFYQAGFSVSASGIVVFQSMSDNVSRLTWFDRLGKELGVIPVAGFRDPVLSRDGSLLAATSDDQLNGKYSTRLYDLIRHTSTVVSNSGTDHFPLLSPDNGTVAFDRGITHTGGGQGSVLIVPADNSRKPEVVVKGPVLGNDWSKDGRYLIYMDFRPGGGYPVLGYYDFEKRSENSYGLGGAEAQLSPDTKWIAFTGPAGESNTPNYQDSEVYVGPFPVPGGRKQVSNNGGAQPQWSPDGKELYYITEDKKLMAVPISIQEGKLVAGIPRMLFQTRIVASRYTLTQYAVAPDGKRFLINSYPPLGAAPLTVLAN